MEILPRSTWGARYEAGIANRPVGNLGRYLHHSVTRHLPVTATLEAEIAQLRAVERIGEQRFGSGMSYTILLAPSARAWEGAGIRRVSAHSGAGRNTSGAGLCLLGNYDENPLHPVTLAGMGELLAHGVREGWWTSPTITQMHREFKATACPGRYAAANLAAINAAGVRALDDAPGRPGHRPPLDDGWRPVVLPELINARLHLAGFPTAGRLQDYDRAAVRRYQQAQVWPGLVDDGLWGPRTEVHYNWTVTLQGALARIGGRAPDGRSPMHLNGSFDQHVRLTVENAQRALGLRPDGVPGPITCAALRIREHP